MRGNYNVQPRCIETSECHNYRVKINYQFDNKKKIAYVKD